MSTGIQLEHDWFPRPLPPNVELGERSWCYSAFSCLHFQSRRPRAVRIGHDTGIYHGTLFDLGPDGEVEIGDYCTLLSAILCTNRRMVIGSYTFIAREVVLADAFAAVPFAPGGLESPRLLGRPRQFEGFVELAPPGARVLQAPPEPSAPAMLDADDSIVIGDNCWLGTRAILLAGARLGEGVIVGAAAVVDFAVPAYAIVAGNPARIVGRSPPAQG